MSQLSGNPEQMLAFSSALNTWCSETREGLLGLHARLTEMAGGDWTDENYRRFVERFEPIAASIMVSLTEFDSDLAPQLRQLAHRYQELLDGGE